MSKYLIPSLEEIKALYNEVIPLMQKLKTKEDVIEFGKKYKTTMEINYDLVDYYDENEPIEVIRCGEWEDLDYIYVYLDGSTPPRFDVWCDFMEYDFIDGATIENLEKNYIEGIRWLWLRSLTRLEDLKEIIEILRQHGIEYNDLIEVYRFDTDVVEEYEDEHYEHGYGDIK